MLDPSKGFLPPLELSPDPDNDRREFLKKAGFVGVSAAVVATAGGPLTDGHSALASTTEFTEPSSQAGKVLPAIGKTFDLSCNAFDTTLFVNMPPPVPQLNFTGRIAVKVLMGGPDWVRLQVLDHSLDAEHPMFGKIAIRLPDTDGTPQSILSVGPSGLVSTMLLSFDVTFERCGDFAGPFTFTTLSPAKLVAALPAFPPPPQSTNGDGSPAGGQSYVAVDPVSVGTIGSTGEKTPYAQLQKMTINLGQSSV